MKTLERKPFSIEDAKAGRKAETRNGKPVEILAWDIEGSYPIAGKLERQIYSFAEDGKWSSDKEESAYDLFVRPEVKFVGLYRYEGSTTLYTTTVCSTPEDAEDALERMASLSNISLELIKVGVGEVEYFA